MRWRVVDRDGTPIVTGLSWRFTAELLQGQLNLDRRGPEFEAAKPYRIEEEEG